MKRAALLLALAAGSAAAQTTAFVDVNVVPMDRNVVLERQTVVVRDGRIASVGPAGSAQIPATAVRIDGRGKYLMPGIAEMHAHVPPGSATEQGLKDLMFQYIANGVTTIRGMLGAPYQLTLRERLARGEILGPTFYVGAPSLNGNSAPTADIAAELVRAHKTAGYDFLKIHPGMTREAYDGMVAAAREVGITWAGHVSRHYGASHAMDTRQSTIDHLDGFVEASVPPGTNPLAQLAELIRVADASRFPALARRSKEMGVWHVPTMLVWQNLFSVDETPEQIAARDEMKYAPPAQVQTWIQQKRNRDSVNAGLGLTPADIKRYMELRTQMLKAVVDADGLLLMGTDSPQLFMVPGFALHRELGIMASAGLTPYQILRSGTVNVAQYARENLKVDGNFGVVAPGMRADLVLLDANPLQDVANLQKRAGVMVKGTWVSADEIRAGLEAIVRR